MARRSNRLAPRSRSLSMTRWPHHAELSPRQSGPSPCRARAVRRAALPRAIDAGEADDIFASRRPRTSAGSTRSRARTPATSTAPFSEALPRKAASRHRGKRPARTFFSRYFRLSRCASSPNGIDTSVTDGAVADPALRDDKMNILFVGRLEKRKGVATSCAHTTFMRSRVTNARLFIVGDGPLRGSAESFISRHRLPDVVMAGSCRTLSCRATTTAPTIFLRAGNGPREFRSRAAEAMACAARRARGFPATCRARAREGQPHRAPQELGGLGGGVGHPGRDPSCGPHGRSWIREAKQYSWSSVATR